MMIKIITTCFLLMMSWSVMGQEIPELTPADLERQSDDYVWRKVYTERPQDPEVSQSIFGAALVGLPALLEFMGGVFEKEKYEPLLEQKAQEKRIKSVAKLEKDYKKGKYPECVYQHLLAGLLDIPPPNCTPWD